MDVAVAVAFLPFSPAPDRSTLRRRLASRLSSPRCRILSQPRLRYCPSSRRSNLYHHKWPTGRVSCNQGKLEDSVDDEACELVNGTELIIGEGHDSIRGYLLKAVKNNNGTGVLLLSDVFGFEDSSTRDFAYRVACNGYNVLVPDMFRGNPWKKGQPVSGFEHWLAGQSPERVAADIGMSAKWLIDEFTAAQISGKLGIIGFGFGGGRLVETLARDEGTSFGTGICFYGVHFSESLAKDVRVPILFICGDGDTICPVSEVREMEKSIGGSRVVMYEGRGHGFAHRPESQEEDVDADDAFDVMRNWLQDGLVVSKDYARQGT